MPLDPQLQFAFEAQVRVQPPLDLGITPAGHRRIVPIAAGEVAGPNLRAKILNVGADWQILHADGAADLEARYLFQADDGALIYVRNNGLRRGNPDVLKRLNTGQSLTPEEAGQIYFRTIATFETSAPQYAWLTNALFIGAGERHPDRVIIRFYQVL